jgi:hypothetical protein
MLIAATLCAMRFVAPAHTAARATVHRHQHIVDATHKNSSRCHAQQQQQQQTTTTTTTTEAAAAAAAAAPETTTVPAPTAAGLTAAQ